MEFLKSPGFAATGAVIAAALTYRAAVRKAAWDSWWERVQWAMERAESEDALVSEFGLAALLGLLDDDSLAPDEKEWLRTPTLNFVPPQVGDPLPEEGNEDVS